MDYAWRFAKHNCARPAFLVLLIGLVVLLFSCEPLERDNPLDPQNPNSTRPRKIVVEAFVNTANPLQINEFALEALYQVQDRHQPQLLVLEYHRDTSQYPDSLALAESLSPYLTYINLFDGQAGLPDIFFNAGMRRVQGASSVGNSITRLENALNGLLDQTSRFAVEVETTRQGDSIIPTVTVARLGVDEARNLIIKAVLSEQVDLQYLRHVVVDVSSLPVTRIASGTFQSFTLPELRALNSRGKLQLTVYLIDRDLSEIYQGVQIDL